MLEVYHAGTASTNVTWGVPMASGRGGGALQGLAAMEIAAASDLRTAGGGWRERSGPKKSHACFWVTKGIAFPDCIAHTILPKRCCRALQQYPVLTTETQKEKITKIPMSEERKQGADLMVCWTPWIFLPTQVVLSAGFIATDHSSLF